jgi:hypothetical protein
MLIVIRKKAFSRTDNLPNFVCGFSCIIFIY